MLSRPTFVIWLISTILAVVVVLMVYGGIAVPVLSPIVSGHTFEVLLIAYVLLWLGTIVSGL
jgi:Na+-translocating ferredoxin:NAD+ oxidoreductase RnfD subunit